MSLFPGLVTISAAVAVMGSPFVLRLAFFYKNEPDSLRLRKMASPP